MGSSNSCASGHSLFLVGSEGLLLHESTRRLYHLNTAAAFVWCCLEEGESQRKIVDAVSSQFGVPRERAHRDVSEAVAEFHRNRLIGNAGVEVLHETSATEFSATVAAPSNRDIAIVTTGCTVPARQPDGKHSHVRCYRIGNTLAHIVYTTGDVGEVLSAVLGHLETRRNLETKSSHDGIHGITVDIILEDAGYAIYCSGKCRAAALGLDHLAPGIQRELLIEAYERSGCLLGVHAGAVGSGGRCILLPGQPGSGKSTLTAALMHSGYTYLTDELALVMRQGHAVHGLPVSLGLKSGAWDALSSRFPEIAELPTHRQADGTSVRYLRPRGTQPPGHRECTAMAVVFPEYEAGAQTQLSPLTTATAIYRLSMAGYAMPDGLTPALLQAVIDWIRPLPCYALRFSDLDEGVRTVSSLLRQQSELATDGSQALQP